jgi:hypothetical protein
MGWCGDHGISKISNILNINLFASNDTKTSSLHSYIIKYINVVGGMIQGCLCLMWVGDNNITACCRDIKLFWGGNSSCKSIETVIVLPTN